MVQMMFETFGVKSVVVVIQACMSLMAHGRTSGIVCDSGDGVTHTVPVWEGFQISSAIERNDVAGRAITDHTKRVLRREIGLILEADADRLEVMKIKEQCGIVALNYNEDVETAKKSTQHNMQYTLCDGQVVDVPARVRYEIPEALFDPKKCNSNERGIVRLIYDSI